MYYDTIEIRFNPLKRKWQVSHSQLHGDRQPCKKYLPSNAGFFHYPRKWPVRKAFDILKDHMIKQHEKEIARLEDSLYELYWRVLPPKAE